MRILRIRIRFRIRFWIQIPNTVGSGRFCLSVTQAKGVICTKQEQGQLQSLHLSPPFLHPESIELFIENQAFLGSCDLAPCPPPPPCPISNLPHFLSLPIRRAYLRGEGRGAKSYEREKARPSINHSILTAFTIHPELTETEPQPSLSAFYLVYLTILLYNCSYGRYFWKTTKKNIFICTATEAGISKNYCATNSSWAEVLFMDHIFILFKYWTGLLYVPVICIVYAERGVGDILRWQDRMTKNSASV